MLPSVLVGCDQSQAVVVPFIGHCRVQWPTEGYFYSKLYGFNNTDLLCLCLCPGGGTVLAILQVCSSQFLVHGCCSPLGFQQCHCPGGHQPLSAISTELLLQHV